MTTGWLHARGRKWDLVQYNYYYSIVENYEHKLGYEYVISLLCIIYHIDSFKLPFFVNG